MTDVPSGKAVVSASLALGVAVGLIAVSYGVLAVANGLSVAQTCAMSVLVFTGASQFAFVGVIATGGSAAAAVGSGLLLAARNGVYGLAWRRCWRSVGSPAPGRPVRDRRVDGDGDGAARSALPGAGGSGGQACRSSSAGTSAP